MVLGDPLRPGTYEFEPAGPVTLSKISERSMHSVTTSGSEPDSSAFRRQLELRDGEKMCGEVDSNFACCVSPHPKTHWYGGCTRYSEEILWRADSDRDPQIRSEDWDPPLYPIK